MSIAGDRSPCRMVLVSRRKTSFFTDPEGPPRVTLPSALSSQNPRSRGVFTFEADLQLQPGPETANSSPL